MVKEVLERLQFNDLYAKAEKCFFEQSSIKNLDIIILENKVQMDKEKLLGVLEWPVPTKVKQVQAFLGFANFYCRFIENFAKMSKPLSNLTKKNSTWTWGKEQQNAFEVLKKDIQTNLWHLVAFFSKLLDIHERNYKIYDKELLAVIRGLEKYRYHLEGYLYIVEIWLDYQNFTFFRTA